MPYGALGLCHLQLRVVTMGAAPERGRGRAKLGQGMDRLSAPALPPARSLAIVHPEPESLLQKRGPEP